MNYCLCLLAEINIYIQVSPNDETDHFHHSLERQCIDVITSYLRLVPTTQENLYVNFTALKNTIMY